MVTGRRSSYMGSAAAGALVAAALVLGGCTALTRDVLVKESGQPAQAVASHCSGSEWMDNSMIAVVPIPIVAFAMPTQELNEIKTGESALTQLEVATGEGSVFVVRSGKTVIAATTGSNPTAGLVFYDLKSALRTVKPAAKPAAKKPAAARKKTATTAKKKTATRKPATKKKPDAS